ncbi:MAG TPA: F0F1 ATP synthase subunit delta [Gammaproteobacteria bacterium]|nr:F0F1 ATP synthase subunit delta [Gammaproteobacteria bacterium]
MAELTTIARPYAQAVFKRAGETGRYPAWSNALQMMATIASDETMAEVIAGAQLSRVQVAELFNEVAGDKLDQEGENLVKLLAENGRLGLLPVIAVQYEALRAEAEGSIDAEIISAFTVTEAQRSKVVESLRARLGREINLSVTINESLVGGAIIRAGDLVIDGSVRGKLDKLASTVNQ